MQSHTQHARDGRIAALVFLLAIAVGGCSPAPNLPEHPPIRLIERQMALQDTFPPEPLVVTLDDAWTALGGEVIPSIEGLRWHSSEEDGAMLVPVSVDTRVYNAIEVRMQVDGGERCEVAWSSNVVSNDPTAPDHDAVRFPIVPGPEPRDYTFILATSPRLPWLGMVDELALRPSTVPATKAIIESVRFVHHPLPRPRQATIDGVSLDVFQGTVEPIRLRVPPGAWFEAHFGVHRIAWESIDLGHATFRACVTTAEGEERVLVEESFSPSYVPAEKAWRSLRLDMADLAGQEVSIALEAQCDALTEGAAAYWGAPTIYNTSGDPEAVPVVLVSCDTLRADHLSCYGYERETSPFLDAWAHEEAVLFKNAIVNETWTLPSHMTMFTGLQPKHHGVTKTADLAEETTTLPELLRRHGYLTAGFTGHAWWLAPPRGFGRGMDYYDISTLPFRHVHETMPLMEKWLDEHRLERRFLFFHNYDVHYKFATDDQEYAYDAGVPEFRVFSDAFDRETLFTAPAMAGKHASRLLAGFRGREFDFSDKEHAFLRAGYDDCVRLVDDAIGKLIERLKREGFYDRAIIIVTADHGETLNDGDTAGRRNYGHDDVYEELCHVPLIIKFPHGAFAGQRFTPMVESADILSTVADVTGMTGVPKTDGQSLWRVLRGKHRPIRETYIHHTQKYAIRTNTWKLHRDMARGNEGFKLFDLETDPGEQNDRYVQGDAIATALGKKLQTYYKPNLAGWNIRFVADDPGWRFSYAATSDGLVESAHRVSRDGELSEQWVDENRVIRQDDSLLWPYVFLRTQSGDDVLHLGLKSPVPCRLAYEGSDETPARTLTASLDPKERRFPKPESFEPHGGPTVFLWHGPPEEANTTQMRATEEIQEQLEALGYVE